MERVRGFPLVLWENTSDYDQKHSAAQTRFIELRKQLDQRRMASFSADSIDFTVNCIPTIWMNAGTPLENVTRHLNALEALRFARRYGSTGKFDIADVEDFLQGKGAIVDLEMEHLDFRKHKTDSTKWARKSHTEKYQSSSIRHEHWLKLYGLDVAVLQDEERDRLRSLQTKPNAGMQLGNTYSIDVGKIGLMLVSLDAQPFALRPDDLSAQLAQRAHIDREQKGFVIEAQNVKLSKKADSNGQHDAIYIKATKPDKIEEVVWPATAYPGTIVDLAVDLRKRMTT